MSLWCYHGGRALYSDVEVERIIAINPYEKFEPADFEDWERVTGKAYVRNPACP